MMPAGKYYIGDLFYVIHEDETWNEVCDLLWSSNGGEFTLKDGRKFAIYPTAYGDGNFDGCDVDSGTIGCILLTDIQDVPKDGWLEREFDSDFETSSDGSTISFGHVDIYTGYDDEDFGDGDSEW